MGDSRDRGTRVYVGGLSEVIKKEHLETEFEKYGKLISVWVAFNPPGFAFIEFSSQGDAETACDNLNGTELMGSKLRVELSRGRSRPRGGGRGGGRGFPSRGGGFRGRGSYDNGGGFRGSRGGSRGRGRFDDYGSRGGGGYDRSYDRDSRRGGGGFRGSRDGYRNEGYGGGAGGGGYDGGSRYRSRSPAPKGRY